MADAVTGKCLLTGKVGKMAKAHIIPNSFMQRASDAPFMECSPAARSKKRYSGWYDPRILGSDGEALIAKYDDAAAKCFIENGYTYWRRRDKIDINRLSNRFTADETYSVEVKDTRQIRLFALSLLWRAAVSKLDAFSGVNLLPGHVRDIRNRLLTGRPGNHLDYPVYFGVFCDGQELSKIGPFRPNGHPFIRFFLDGVLCYISPRKRLKNASDYGLLLAGAERRNINLYCFSSLNSAHAEYTDRGLLDIELREGDIFAPFSGAADRRRHP